jgi:hypothetical protein
MEFKLFVYCRYLKVMGDVDWKFGEVDEWGWGSVWVSLGKCMSEFGEDEWSEFYEEVDEEEETVKENRRGHVL